MAVDMQSLSSPPDRIVDLLKADIDAFVEGQLRSDKLKNISKSDSEPRRRLLKCAFMRYPDVPKKGATT